MTYKELFSLRAGSDFEATIETISQGVSLRGYNFWMLVCSSILACVGLDTNSTAIIIGAMLISPLMSPILGVGLSVAVHDKKLLSHSLRNLGIAAFVSLFVASLYFAVSPLGHVTHELEARTYPTLLDVIVALFGGFAGIISISRRDQTNAIPGVAIATALMPPLCTAGFGIAKLEWNFFAGAFYLFVINAIFISMATYLIVKYLHFPEKEFSTKKTGRVYAFWFNLLGFIAILPSTYFLFTVYQDQQRKDKLHELVISKIEKNGNEILKWEVEQADSINYIKVYHSGVSLSDSLKGEIDSSLTANRLGNFRLQSMRVNLTKEEVNQMSAEVAKQIFTRLQIERAASESNKIDTVSYTQLSKEVRAFLPVIDSSYNGWLLIPSGSGKSDSIPVFYYSAVKRLASAEQRRLTEFLKQRLVSDTAIINYIARPKNQKR